MINQGYRQGNADHMLFFKHHGGKITSLLCMLMILSSQEGNDEILKLNRCLAKEFEMKELGLFGIFWELRWQDQQKELF